MSHVTGNYILNSLFCSTFTTNMLEKRVESNLHICGIQLDVSATEFAAGNLNSQPFYNTTLSGGDFKEVYHAKGSVGFSEVSNSSAAGLSYSQKVTLKFPSNDAKRSQRIEALRAVKFLSVKFSNEQSLIFGRNDFFQNTAPKIAIKSTAKTTTVEVSTSSVFPVGFFQKSFDVGYVYEFPISFLESL